MALEFWKLLPRLGAMFMPAQLLALTDGPTILMDKPILLFGRHPECDIQLNSRKISRRHCCLAQVGEYLVIRDLGSTNGVRINGARVVEGRLRAGDELTIGNFRYQVCWDTPTGARTAPPGPARRPISDEQLEDAEEPVELDELPPGRVAVPARPVRPIEDFRLPDHLSLIRDEDAGTDPPPRASTGR